ncbi:MAG: hypothetical protein ACI965_000151, partial [Paraglaciecola sp.]
PTAKHNTVGAHFHGAMPMFDEKLFKLKTLTFNHLELL